VPRRQEIKKRRFLISSFLFYIVLVRSSSLSSFHPSLFFQDRGDAVAGNSRTPSSARNRPYFAGSVLNAASRFGFLQPVLAVKKQHLRRTFFCNSPSRAAPRRAEVRARADIRSLLGSLCPPRARCRSHEAIFFLFAFFPTSSRTIVDPDSADAPRSTCTREPCADDAGDETKSKSGVYIQRNKNEMKKAWKKQ